MKWYSVDTSLSALLTAFGLTVLVACADEVALGGLSEGGTSGGHSASVCGDGVIQAGDEECDDGAQNGPQAACTADCKVAVCGDGNLLIGVEVCDDGNLVDGDGCSATCEAPPAAVELNLSFSQIKQFDFSWKASSGATFYQLIERPTKDAAYAKLGADITGESISLTMPLHLRFGASYVLRACNAGGCSDSAPVEVVDSMASAVGYFKASNTGSLDYFAAVALSADGDTLAVGARVEDSAATGIDGDQTNDAAKDSGAVYVFQRVNGTWSQQAYIKASNADTGDEFGGQLVLSASGDTLVVGARFEDSAATGVDGDQASDGAPDSGAVYVFARTGGTWSQQGYLKASNTGATDWFGTWVAVAADGDTIAVGAYQEDSAAKGVNGDQANNATLDAGAVYVFRRTGDAWSQQAYVKASNPGEGDWFGAGLALSADGNTLAVGARQEDSAAAGINGDQASEALLDVGAVYVFRWANGAWSQQAYIKPSNPDACDRFGWSLALSADGTTLAVGAPGEAGAKAGVGADQASNAAAWAGAVYLFVREKDAWSQQAYIKSTRPRPYVNFGMSIALSADGNLLVAAAEHERSGAVGIGGDEFDDSADVAGAVYVFERTKDAWLQRAYVKASNTSAYDSFGYSLGLSADGMTLAVGAVTESSDGVGIGANQSGSGAYESGAVFLY